MSASRDEIALLAKIPAGKAIWSLSGDEAREYYEDKICNEVDIIGGKYRRVAHIEPIQHPDMGTAYALIFLREIRGCLRTPSFFLSADAAGAALMDVLVNDVNPHMARPGGKIITSGLAQSDEKPDGKITKTGISWRKVSKEWQKRVTENPDWVSKMVQEMLKEMPWELGGAALEKHSRGTMSAQELGESLLLIAKHHPMSLVIASREFLRKSQISAEVKAEMRGDAAKGNENYADSPTATEGFFAIFSKSHLTPQEQKSVRRLLKKIPAAKLMRELKMRDAQEKDNAKRQEIWNRQIELADKMDTRWAVGIM